MRNFKLLNTLTGLIVFAIAAATYLLTIESTASFWDCGEFISSAYKLDVGHPPGAPFFMLTAHFFTLFARDASQVAVMVNSMSALLSALTILFLFWTITAMARKMVVADDEQMTLAQGIGILFSGAVGALAYTFSDTFWFSAVEGEVYAYSSFFTALVFWAILKWEEVADEPGSDRWLIFIAYMMGLSIGVHLLNLLAIPAIVLVYYFHRFKPNFWGFCLAMVVSAALLAVVLYGLIPGFVLVAGWFELLFTNHLGMPFNTGLMVYIILTLAILVWGIVETRLARSNTRMIISVVLSALIVGIPFFGSSVVLGVFVTALLLAVLWWQRERISARWLHTSLLMIALMLVGYSSYTVIVIRSASDPAMDQNSPDNVFALKYYLNREQYGDRPLFYGPSYTAQLNYKRDRLNGQDVCRASVIEGDAQYAPHVKTSPDEPDHYDVVGHKLTYDMCPEFKLFFPRMYSTQASHREAYETWAGKPRKRVVYDVCGQRQTGTTPTFGQNLKFFFSYQCNFMYWRYFMWNFAGRQNDLQGYGEVDKGNWICGIPFIDNALVGDQSKLPDVLRNNKGHNVYYLLPLLLGLLGIAYQLGAHKKGVQSFIVTLMLFFMTGLAIVMYLNQTPYQPRERDYAYAGSFYAFCIWIGLGVLFLAQQLERIRMPRWLAATLAGIVCLGVPALMAQQNWDDHDRSGRYVARDFGHNYLASLRPNAVIFTNGDNDTFPLWYNQEVEGNGSDDRVCNLSYLQTDWYIDQMCRPYYESAALPISWTRAQYSSSKNEYTRMQDFIHEPISVRDAFDWMLSDDPATKINDDESVIPSRQLYIDVDRDAVLNSPAFTTVDSTGNAVCRFDSTQIADRVMTRYGDQKSGLTRSEMMVLDMLQTNGWQRPIYFAVTVGNDYYHGLEPYFELTGMAYQVTPVRSSNGSPRINMDEMYDNLMHRFRFGNVKQPGIYLDENVLRMCRTHRMMFAQLSDELIRHNRKEDAVEVLDTCMANFPLYNVPADYSTLQMALCYIQAGASDKALPLLTALADDCVQYVEWGQSIKPSMRKSIARTMGNQLAMLQEVLRMGYEFELTDITDRYMEPFSRLSSSVTHR